MAILSVRHLSIDYLERHPQNGGKESASHAVIDVSFDLVKGRSLALVGESGCGKTTTSLALLRLLPANGRIVSGQIRYNDIDLLGLSEREMRAVRWKNIAIVFQGAMNALNPVRRIDDQIIEVLRLHETVKEKRQARDRVVELMELVGISPDRARQYPHQFSGGMRQRAMIAMALACNPDILIADEPTTALDVMIQAQILTLLETLQKLLGLSIILVTHDLGVVAEMCDDVLIMNGGRIVEYGNVDTIYNAPQHPYTRQLLSAFPDIDTPITESINGTVPVDPRSHVNGSRG